MTLFLIPALYAVCFAGMAYCILKMMQEGAEKYSEEQAEDTARALEDLFLFIPPERISVLSRLLALAVFALVFLAVGDLSSGRGLAAGFVAASLAGFLVLSLPRWLIALLRQRRLERFNAQLVDALTTISNSLRAGFSIMQCFETIVKEGQAPIAQEFGVFLHETRVGVRFEDALTGMEKRVESEDLSLMIRAIETARLTGGNLTEVFDGIAKTIRERVRIEGRIRSLTAQGRLQAMVVGLLPVLLLLAMTFIDPKMMFAFFTSPQGVSLLGLAAILEVIGIMVIRKMVRIRV